MPLCFLPLSSAHGFLSADVNDILPRVKLKGAIVAGLPSRGRKHTRMRHSILYSRRGRRQWYNFLHGRARTEVAHVLLWSTPTLKGHRGRCIILGLLPFPFASEWILACTGGSELLIEFLLLATLATLTTSWAVSSLALHSYRCSEMT